MSSYTLKQAITSIRVTYFALGNRRGLRGVYIVFIMITCRARNEMGTTVMGQSALGSDRETREGWSIEIALELGYITCGNKLAKHVQLLIL